MGGAEVGEVVVFGAKGDRSANTTYIYVNWERNCGEKKKQRIRYKAERGSQYIGSRYLVF